MRRESRRDDKHARAALLHAQSQPEKRKITAARIPYRVPADHDLPERLPSVLAVVYLVHNEGHTASSGADLTRPDLGAQALRLGHVLHELMPDEPERRLLEGRFRAAPRARACPDPRVRRQTRDG